MLNITTLKTVIKQWLRQLLILWLILNVYDAVYFIYRSYLWKQLTAQDHIANELLQRFISHNFHQSTIPGLILVTLLAELNYQYIFKRYSWYVFTGGVLITAIIYVGMLAMFQDDGYEINLLEPFSVIAVYAFGYTLLREFFYHKLYSFKVRANRSENELQALKQQLNPHFLFNTLNYLYGTALQENAPRTAEGIDMMAGMMRYTVTGMQETYTPLAAEIAFIQQYLHLQSLRMPSENAKLVTAEIQTTTQPLYIAPLLLMPFIENAFKYGVSNDEQTPIDISISTSGTELQMAVSNAIVNNPNAVPGTNSGLALTRKRLELLYPGKYHLEILTQQQTFGVKLRLQLN
jgi:sensor histidine kinase YesM